jgi:glutaminyl-tRNA synthetase
MAAKEKETEPSSSEDLESKFKAIGLNDKLTKEALKSKLVRPSLDKTIDEAGVTHLDPATGALILSLATATQKGTYESRPKIAKAIIDGRLKSSKQVEGTHLDYVDAAAVEYLKVHDKTWVEVDMEAASGVGVNVTEAEIKQLVNTYMSTNNDMIVTERYKAQPAALKAIGANPLLKWADPKLRTECVTKAFEHLLGPKDERDAPVKKVIHDGVGLTVGKNKSKTHRSNAGETCRNRARNPVDHVYRRLAGKSP